MAQVEVRDHVIWLKHIHGDAPAVEQLRALAPGDVVELVVDGVPGTWSRMSDGAGSPTPGFKPLGEARTRWHSLYEKRRGALLPLQVRPAHGPHGPQSAPLWATASKEERHAAWEAFKALTRAGWRTEASKPFDRDELHER
jgi:hypothetical protein